MNKSAIAAVMGFAILVSGTAFAQQRGPKSTYSQSPFAIQAPNDGGAIGDEPFSRRYTLQNSAPAIVTRHELSHHVPRRAMLEHDQALKALKKRDLSTAIQHFETAVALDPEFFHAFYDLGTIHL